MDPQYLMEQFRLAAEAGSTQPGLLYLPKWNSTHWDELAAYCEPVQLQAGDGVIASGSYDRALYFLAEGEVEVAFVIKHSMTVSIMTLVGPGSTVGEQSFFDASPRSANVWAVGPCKLLKLELKAFEKYAETSPKRAYEMVFGLGRILAHRLRLTTAKVSA